MAAKPETSPAEIANIVLTWAGVRSVGAAVAPVLFPFKLVAGMLAKLSVPLPVIGPPASPAPLATLVTVPAPRLVFGKLQAPVARLIKIASDHEVPLGLTLK